MNNQSEIIEIIKAYGHYISRETTESATIQQRDGTIETMYRLKTGHWLMEWAIWSEFVNRKAAILLKLGYKLEEDD